MASIVYDFAIIGTGAAGLHLALAMKQDPYFDDKKILLIDKSKKDVNDKTWCFWEKGDGKWDDITTKTWRNCQFINSFEKLDISFAPYNYKMVQALDFYNHAKREINQTDIFEIITDEVESIKCQENVTIETSGNVFLAKHIFDSRISQDFYSYKDNYTRLLQHFKGWIIETNEDQFDDSSFTMMDFSVKWPSTTSFMYVLPTSKTSALLEYTFFSKTLANEEDYDKMLKNYVEEILGVKKYTIKDIEKGVIPMSNYPFHKHNTDQITKIGTAGGWVKPSSGYSFKNAERSSLKVVDNIKKGIKPSSNIINKRFLFYDSIFLKVLNDQNYLGESIFSDMYKKNDISSILSFLDEQTSIVEEIRIINKFQKTPFIKALLKNIFS
ncbi:lycopene cyclase family protein [Fulvivirga sp.]|uniref:lycopene cyclase family protein n=1 Tax=Fulvivirga sp. TaxID=1931237 RepID=UPI0032EC9D04